MINRAFIAPTVIVAVTMCITGSALALNDNVTTIVKSSPISVWFGNDANKSITLVGPTGASATVPLKKLAAPITVVNIAGVAYVQDTLGNAAIIDPVRLVVGAESKLSDANAQLVGNGGRLYSVDVKGGAVVELDPVSLAPRGAPVEVKNGSQGLGTAVADKNGVLWVTNQQTGDVVAVTGPVVSSTQSIAEPSEEVQLSVVNESVVTINTTTGKVKVISGPLAGTDRQLSITPPTGVLLPTTVNSSTVLPILTTDHTLTLLNVATGTTVVQQIGEPTSRLGVPVVAGARVYIPDYSRGVLLVVDVASAQVIDTIAITGGPGEFEVLESGGRVFVNDPKSEAAWTIDEQGKVSRTQKYDPNGKGGTATELQTPGSVPPKVAPTSTKPSTTQPSTTQPSLTEPPRPTTTLAPVAPAGDVVATTKVPPSTVPSVVVVTRPPKVIQVPTPPTTIVRPTRPPEFVPTSTVPPVIPSTATENTAPESPPRTSPDVSTTNVTIPSPIVPGDPPAVTTTTSVGLPSPNLTTIPPTIPPIGPTTTRITSTSTPTTTNSGPTTSPPRPTSTTLTTNPPTATTTAPSTTAPPTIAPPTTAPPTIVTTTIPATTTIAYGNGAITAFGASSTAAGSITATWGPPTNWYNVTGYTATLLPTGTKVDLSAAQTTYTFGGLDSGQSYSIQVAAKSSTGMGIATQSLAVTPLRATAGAPQNVAATGASGTITVTWDGPASGQVDGFVVDLTGGGTTTSKRVGGTVRTAQFTGLTNGLTYSSSVKSELTNGSASGAVAGNSVTLVGVPSAPTGVTATVSGPTSITLSWSAATANGSPITGYAIVGATVPDVGPTGTSLVINGLVVGQSYTLGVRALSAAGSGPVASAAAITVIKQTPDEPGSVSALAGDAQVTVSWTAANGNATTVARYVVTGSDGATSTVNAPATSVTLAAVNGTAVTYSVVTVGANNLSSGAVGTASVTPSGAPTAPDISLTATATALTASFTYPTASNGTTIANVVVNVNGTDYPVTASPFTATGLTPSTAYNVVLKVTGANGKVSSKSGSISTLSALGPVTGLRYTQPVNGSSANIIWVAPAGAVSYRVTVDGSVVGTVSATNLRIFVTPEVEASVTVTPIDASGAEGPGSTISVITVDDSNPNPNCPPRQICPIP